MLRFIDPFSSLFPTTVRSGPYQSGPSSDTCKWASNSTATAPGTPGSTATLALPVGSSSRMRMASSTRGLSRSTSLSSTSPLLQFTVSYLIFVYCTCPDLVCSRPTAARDFKVSTESEFVPLLGLEEQLNSTADTSKDNKHPPGASSIQNNHHPAFLSLLASELSVAPESIYDFELSVALFHPSLQRLTRHATVIYSISSVRLSVVSTKNSSLALA